MKERRKAGPIKLPGHSGSSQAAKGRSHFLLDRVIWLRVSELSGIKLRDIDLKNQKLRIVAAKGRLTRTEDITADIWRKLEAWLKKKDKGEGLFPGRLPGRPVSTDRLKALFEEVACRDGWPKDFSVHSLLHTLAIMMVDSGASPIRMKT